MDTLQFELFPDFLDRMQATIRCCPYCNKGLANTSEQTLLNHIRWAHPDKAVQFRLPTIQPPVRFTPRTVLNLKKDYHKKPAMTIYCDL